MADVDAKCQFEGPIDIVVPFRLSAGRRGGHFRLNSRSLPSCLPSMAERCMLSPSSWESRPSGRHDLSMSTVVMTPPKRI